MPEILVLSVRFVLFATVAAALTGISPAMAESRYDIAWFRQIGTTHNDQSGSVAIDALGNAYISGFTEGDLDGTNAGLSDAFLCKYGSAGNLLWSRQIGTVEVERSRSVAVDNLGNAYISGSTGGNLAGMSAGGVDAFLTKYDSSGGVLWSRQLGTTTFDDSFAVAVDASGNAYVSGVTYGDLAGTNAGQADAFLAKFNSAGAVLWSRQIGTTFDEEGFAVSVDGAGNAYISGYTFGDLDGMNSGGQDALLAKYNSSGDLLWTRQLGTPNDDWSSSVVADAAGNIYLGGVTYGDLGGTNAGGRDAFVAKYDATGVLLWCKQVGTTGNDSGDALAVDSFGNAFISGFTLGDLGDPNLGGADAFVTKYTSAGELLWSRQLGTPDDDAGTSIAVDATGKVYISGFTLGDLEGMSLGEYDAFLVKLVPLTAVPGDFDADGDVDGADFVAWQTHFPTASGATRADGDADGDGDVDGADFVVWQTNFPFTPAPSIHPIPEPLGITQAVFGILAIALGRRIRASYCRKRS